MRSYFIVLKGQHLLAQGKRRRSVALGWERGLKFVRGKKHVKELLHNRTKWSISIFPLDYLLNSVRNMAFTIKILASRTDSDSPLYYPGWRFGSFLPKLYPGLVYFGLSGREKICHQLVYND